MGLFYLDKPHYPEKKTKFVQIIYNGGNLIIHRAEQRRKLSVLQNQEGILG